ncbi:MAG: RNA methyltransferase [Bacteroidota bacterium]
MNEKRRTKMWAVAKRRQSNLTVILENVHDQHNIGAVLRSCDSVGIPEIYILQSDPNLQKTRLALGKKTSAGSRKWVDAHYYTDTEKCFQKVRERYDFIYSTHLATDSKSLYELNLTTSVALLFGNEKSGLSEAALAHSDGNFIIPQVGMASSLNISVACAISVYEAFRQRKLKGFYDENLVQTEGEQQTMFENYVERHKIGDPPKKTYRLD